VCSSDLARLIRTGKATSCYFLSFDTTTIIAPTIQRRI
jgi:hypothetical protein